jgi:WD40 repeat protein
MDDPDVTEHRESAPNGAGRDARRRPPERAPLLVGLVAAGAIVAVGGFAVLQGGKPAASSAPSAGSSENTGAGVPATREPGGTRGTPSTVPAGSTTGSIAVVGRDGSLSLVDPSRQSAVLSDAAGVSFGFPTWSPDGSRVAAVGYRGTEASISIFAARSGTTDPSPGPVVIYRSSDASPFYLYWLPDGRNVSFLATEPDGLSLRLAPVDGSAPLDGSGPGAVIRRGAPLYYDWIAADRLLMHVGSGSEAFLGEVGLDGTPTAPALAMPGNFRSAVVSKDGQYLAYVRAGKDGSGDVVVASRDGSSEHTLPVFGTDAIVFDPTGDTVASIGSDKPGQTDLAFPIGPLRLIDARSGAVRTLLDGLVVGFFWSPDGRTIAALRLQAAGGTIAESGPILAAAAISSPTASPSAPPTEVRLVFVDVTTGTIRSERVVRPGRRFVREFLPYFDQYALSHRVWAPDGSAILLPLVSDTEKTQLVALPPDGDDSPFTIDGEIGFWSP